jgi:hypothetical protein
MDVNNLVKKWIEAKDSKPESDYEQAKREFERALGKPFITLRVEIPAGFEEFGTEFRKLETDKQFQEEVEDLVKKRILFDSEKKKV